jgi:predicted nucleotide-binding protein
MTQEENFEMNKTELIQSLIDATNTLPHRDDAALDALKKRAVMIVRNIFEEKGGYAAAINNIRFRPMVYPATESSYDKSWNSGKQKMLSLLKSMLEELKLFADRNVEETKKNKAKNSNRVFVVHGHDKEMKAEVALIVTKLGLDPIILHEQPDKGRTIIEKFEKYSDVSYAIVLLSPDDYGYSKNQSPKKRKLRSRQNVIFELGFFIGKLGRERVLAIHRKSKKFEFPSDYSGIIYKPYDNLEKWKSELVKELRGCGYNVSADKI